MVTSPSPCKGNFKPLPISRRRGRLRSFGGFDHLLGEGGIGGKEVGTDGGMDV
jgi:hypothetical protein